MSGIGWDVAATVAGVVLCGGWAYDVVRSPAIMRRSYRVAGLGLLSALLALIVHAIWS